MSIIAWWRPLAAVRRREAAIVDLAVAAAALIVSLAFLAHGFGAARPGVELDPTGGVLAAVSTLPLVAWRRVPFAVFVVTAGASTLAAGLGYSIEVPPGPAVALYQLAASRDEQHRWSNRHTVAAAGFLAAYLAASAVADRAFPGHELLHVGLAWSAAWFAGQRTRLLRERMAELKERALRAQKEAESDRRLAVAEERTRIARDLHDSAGHAINVIAVRAGAARLRHEREPQRSLAALQAIEEVARQTAADLDRTVHALREGDGTAGEPAVQPGLASRETLVGHHALAGVDVIVRRSGKPRPLGTAADQAVYRILQEALTNAARHGTGPPTLELNFGDGGLEVTVTNQVSAAGGASPGGGHGLIGMRERATLLGGTLEAGYANGAFRVRARIPYGG